MEKGVFLDRDGIVNVDKGYVYQKEDFLFHKDIFELCRLFQEKGFRIFIITNQSGIARGYYTLDAFNALNEWMLKVFTERQIHISKVYFCPHHPTEGLGEFRIDCQCRKPNPGMILKAGLEFHLNLNESILVGDSKSDIQAGINAGIGYNFWVRGKPNPDMNLTSVEFFDDLAGLIVHIRDVFK